jgi:hypothetical protein
MCYDVVNCLEIPCKKIASVDKIVLKTFMSSVSNIGFCLTVIVITRDPISTSWEKQRAYANKTLETHNMSIFS